MTAVEPTTVDTTTGDHDAMAHIVYPASAVTEAYVTGMPVVALCGKLWTPSKDPERLPVCQTCIEVFERVTGRRWGA